MLMQVRHLHTLFTIALHLLLLMSCCAAIGPAYCRGTAETSSYAKLPLSLKELQCGRLPYGDVLLPLRYLQCLDILSCRGTAADLARLSNLTALTHISLCYIDSPEFVEEHYYGITTDYYVTDDVVPEAASAAWPALGGKLRQLHIIDERMKVEEFLPYLHAGAAVRHSNSGCIGQPISSDQPQAAVPAVPRGAAGAAGSSTKALRCPAGAGAWQFGAAVEA
jgi:hypothetical protein